jgi:hypothetical protein
MEVEASPRALSPELPLGTPQPMMQPSKPSSQPTITSHRTGVACKEHERGVAEVSGAICLMNGEARYSSIAEANGHRLHEKGKRKCWKHWRW